MDFVSSSMTRHALISWPKVNGVASCRWVRPNLTIAAFSLLQTSQQSDQLLNRRVQFVFYVQHAGDVHSSRECIIGALTFIHMVVGVGYRRQLAGCLGSPALRSHSY